MTPKRAANRPSQGGVGARELAGFAAVVVAFIAAFTLLDVEPQSWASFALLGAFLAVLIGYRTWLRRR